MTPAANTANGKTDFKKVEMSRPPFDMRDFRFEQTPDPDWTPGSGANTNVDGSWHEATKEEIDPYAEGRQAGDNYRLLISGVVPRPIGFVSTVDGDGNVNIAPFSYTSFVCHDPPIFCIGVSGGPGSFKDTCVNLLETQECTINMISEWFIEAANYTATSAPHRHDEFAISGLTKAASSIVKPPHVKESAFSVECKLVHHHKWHSKTTGRETGTLFIVEGVNFHVRQDMLNEQKNCIDITKYKPVSRLGGVMYGRTTHAYELPRPSFDEEVACGNIKDEAKSENSKSN